MKARIERFMHGRYGMDNLNRALSIAIIALCLISFITRSALLEIAYILILALYVFRTMSKNTEKRVAENYAYLRLVGKPKGAFQKVRRRISQSRTHRFYKCPACRNTLRVPKGKGKIKISCPKCSASFEKRS